MLQEEAAEAIAVYPARVIIAANSPECGAKTQHSTARALIERPYTDCRKTMSFRADAHTGVGIPCIHQRDGCCLKEEAAGAAAS